MNPIFVRLQSDDGSDWNVLVDAHQGVCELWEGRFYAGSVSYHSERGLAALPHRCQSIAERLREELLQYRVLFAFQERRRHSGQVAERTVRFGRSPGSVGPRRASSAAADPLGVRMLLAGCSIRLDHQRVGILARRCLDSVRNAEATRRRARMIARA
ncbi:MAG: hypothetical protein H0W72_04975 [Planctomycetes bacterium]|nr:hypothetical protein [Planctomycetota bacterium]